MQRWMAGCTIALVACAGHVRVATAPALAATTPDSVPVTVPLPAPVADTPPPRAVSTGPAARFLDTTATPALKEKLDSVADALALDSLKKVAPAASLPDLPIDAQPRWDLNVTDFADQPRVQYYLDYFTGRAHERFQVWLDRMARFEAYARSQFQARKLPGDFVYLALIESGFSPEAVSRVSAVGMWQFMVGTGRLYGLRADSWVDERRDPIKATDAAAHYLEDLTLRFGSHYLAAAAYNTGAGRVQRGLDRINSSAAVAAESDSVDGSRDGAFFSLADTRLIYAETKNYVPQLIAAAIIAKEPRRYGFSSANDVVPFPRDSVIVDGGTGLDLIARLADTTVEALHELNPHLLRMVTPPGESYAVRVPAGSADRIASRYTAMLPDARHAIETHQVRRGETVATLARKFGASAALIREANRSARGKALAPGTTLYIPVDTLIPASFLREPDPPRTTRTVTRTYIVRAGEGITAVARRAGVSVATLRSQNHLTPTATLRSGQKLTVRVTLRSTPRRRTRRKN